jgi:hypothetical protein
MPSLNGPMSPEGSKYPPEKVAPTGIVHAQERVAEGNHANDQRSKGKLLLANAPNHSLASTVIYLYPRTLWLLEPKWLRSLTAPSASFYLLLD